MRTIAAEYDMAPEERAELMNPANVISKEDWIIIRLIRAKGRGGVVGDLSVRDVHAAAYYLFKKYGWEMINTATAILDAEGKK